MSKDRKGSLIGESDVITLYCQPFQRLCDLYLSFNTNQKPRIKSPKSGDLENKNYVGRSPDPFPSRPKAKEGKAVWLRETMSWHHQHVYNLTLHLIDVAIAIGEVI